MSERILPPDIEKNLPMALMYINRATRWPPSELVRYPVSLILDLAESIFRMECYRSLIGEETP